MTEKELRKLNRTELLEMLIAQSKRLSRVEEELSAAQKELERRKIAITTSGHAGGGGPEAKRHL